MIADTVEVEVEAARGQRVERVDALRAGESRAIAPHERAVVGRP